MEYREQEPGAEGGRYQAIDDDGVMYATEDDGTGLWRVDADGSYEKMRASGRFYAEDLADFQEKLEAILNPTAARTTTSPRGRVTTRRTAQEDDAVAWSRLCAQADRDHAKYVTGQQAKHAKSQKKRAGGGGGHGGRGGRRCGGHARHGVGLVGGLIAVCIFGPVAIAFIVVGIVLAMIARLMASAVEPVKVAHGSRGR